MKSIQRIGIKEWHYGKRDIYGEFKENSITQEYFPAHYQILDVGDVTNASDVLGSAFRGSDGFTLLDSPYDPSKPTIPFDIQTNPVYTAGVESYDIHDGTIDKFIDGVDYLKEKSDSFTPNDVIKYCERRKAEFDKTSEVPDTQNTNNSENQLSIDETSESYPWEKVDCNSESNISSDTTNSPSTHDTKTETTSLGNANVNPIVVPYDNMKYYDTGYLSWLRELIDGTDGKIIVQTMRSNQELTEKIKELYDITVTEQSVLNPHIHYKHYCIDDYNEYLQRFIN